MSDPAPARARAALEPAALALLLACVAVALGRLGDWRVQLRAFQLLMLPAFALYAVAVARRRRWARGRRAAATLLLGALAMRVAVLPVAPTLSDDIYRYAWEGRVLAHGGNPYAHAPDDPALAPLRDAVIHPRVNHPSLTAIYPPLAEAGFALVARVRDSLPAMKLWVLLHDLALCACLAWWCARRGGSAWDAVAYAWNPLVVVEYAGSGHHDPTGLLWLVVALALAGTRPAASAAAAVASVLVKLVALPALPFVARDWPRRVRLAALLALALGLGGYGLLARGPHSGLQAFASHWRHNESLFALAAWVLGDERARVAAGVALALVVGWTLLRRVETVAATRRVLRAGLLLGPVLHPWYLGWVLALEPLGPSPAWLVLSGTVLLGYGSFASPAEGGAYHPGVAWRCVEYGLPALVAAGGWLARRRGTHVRTAARGGEA